MADDERGFDQVFRSNLVPAQRREILATLRATLKRDTTLGQIIDAAESLGWGEAMGDLRLADLARSLLVGADAAGSSPAGSTRPQATSAPLHGDDLNDSVSFAASRDLFQPRDIDESEGLEALEEADGSEVFAGDLVAELAPPARKGTAKTQKTAALFVGEGWERSTSASQRKRAGSPQTLASAKGDAPSTKVKSASSTMRATQQQTVIIEAQPARASSKSKSEASATVSVKPARKSESLIARPSATNTSPARTVPAAKKAPAKKAPASRAPATKAPATKASATKASATKASATKASATKASATKASATKASATKVSAKTSSAKTASAKTASAKTASAKTASAKVAAANKGAAKQSPRK